MFSIIGLCAFFKRRAGGGGGGGGGGHKTWICHVNVHTNNQCTVHFKEITKTKSQLISKMSAFALPAQEIYTNDR